jgi:HK97 gp10 family phage protein
MIKLTVEPTRKLNQSVKILFDRTDPRYMVLGAMAGAKVIAERARELVAVDSGDLKSTIRVLPGRTVNRTASAMVTAGGRAPSGNDVNYAGYQEFGTSRMPAHPFLRPAVIEFKADAIKETGDAVWTIITDPRAGNTTFGMDFDRQAGGFQKEGPPKTGGWKKENLK